MPAYAMGMARSVPNDLNLNNGAANSAPVANPAIGANVLMNPFGGPKGSPLDKDSANNASTGALCTGIGFGANCQLPGGITTFQTATRPANFNDDYTPGLTKPDMTAAVDSRLVAIGGGKNVLTAGAGADWSRATSAPVPYTAGFALEGFGGGGSRDAGAGPVFTGFPIKSVTAAADIAVAGVIETGFVNRSGAILKSGSSQFGSASAAQAALA
jgi:hypothetical protein